MRVLAVHADSLAFEAVQPASESDAATPATAPATGELDECVVGFVAVERSDRADLDAVGTDAAAELDAVADRLGAERIALIPREHLIDDPASAGAAAVALEALAEQLDPERAMLRAPAGWRLAVDVERKGHPFAERSIRVVPRRHNGAGSATPNRDGATPNRGGANATDALSALGLATPEPAADGDAVRWLPRGQFLRSALREYGEKLLADADATPVSTPALDVHAAADRREGAERSGSIVGPADRNQLLRPHVHGGLLSALADAIGDGASADDAPVRLRETARWTPERAANVPPEAFDRRARPEYHAALPDEAAAIDELERLAGVASTASGALGADTATLRLAEQFAADRPGFGDRIAAALDDPVAVETVAGDSRYWAARLTFVATDDADREFTLGSVELAAATPERFGVERGDVGGPSVLVHAAPIGDVEGSIAALATRAAASERGGLPIWLAPTQVRLVPIDDRHVDFCDDAAMELYEEGVRGEGVRADVDTRDATVGERLDRAARERVPYVAVVGDRELEEGVFPVTVFETGREERLSVDGLRERVLAECEGRFGLEESLPRRVGAHPSVDEK